MILGACERGTGGSRLGGPAPRRVGLDLEVGWTWGLRRRDRGSGRVGPGVSGPGIEAVAMRGARWAGQ